MTTRAARQYWLWVSRPEYYLDDDGNDRRDLGPSRRAAPGNWWTCDGKTRKGDRILLYRTAPKKDIAYWIEAATDARRHVPSSADATERGWKWDCGFRVLEKFDSPITLDDLANDLTLRKWPPYLAHFRLKSYSIAPHYWKALLRLARTK
jgi:hypothetical protein